MTSVIHFNVLAVLGAAVAVWAALAVPAVPPLPKQRQIPQPGQDCDQDQR
ncbi:hypothetical protein ACWGH4_11510 [Streptomyces sp. NPDC054847]